MLCRIIFSTCHLFPPSPTPCRCRSSFLFLKAREVILPKEIDGEIKMEKSVDEEGHPQIEYFLMMEQEAVLYLIVKGKWRTEEEVIALCDSIKDKMQWNVEALRIRSLMQEAYEHMRSPFDFESTAIATYGEYTMQHAMVEGNSAEKESALILLIDLFKTWARMKAWPYDTSHNVDHDVSKTENEKRYHTSPNLPLTFIGQSGSRQEERTFVPTAEVQQRDLLRDVPPIETTKKDVEALEF